MNENDPPFLHNINSVMFKNGYDYDSIIAIFETTHRVSQAAHRKSMDCATQLHLQIKSTTTHPVALNVSIST